MSRWVRTVASVALLGAVLWRVGTGPFVDGLRLAGGWPLLLGALLGVPVTLGCAWRWRLVATGLGADLPLTSAVAACYRAQLLNTTLPGGVLGDLDRGARHGRAGGDLGRGLRAVVEERAAGQVVQAGATVVVLLVLPSPARAAVPAALGLVSVPVLAVGLVLGAVPAATRSGRLAGRARAVLRHGVLVVRTPGVVAASLLAVTGLVATFLVAARAAGVRATPAELLPLALLVLLAMAVPLNVAGWGPREGMAAWAFSAAGLGAAQGVTTAVVYGVMVAVAGLPGAVVLLGARRHG